MTWLTNDGNGLGGTTCTMQINNPNNNDSEAAAQIASRSRSSIGTTTTGATATANTRSEEAQVRLMQKRKREKQQRNDVNRQFAKLLEFLKLIEQEAEEMGRQNEDNDDYSASGCYGSVSTIMALSTSTGPTNRVDLIARTIIHLEHLNRTAKKQKVEIEELSNLLEQTKRSREETPFPLNTSSTISS